MTALRPSVLSTARSPVVSAPASRRLDAWFEERGWTPLEFQRRTWRAYLDGASGLVHAPTGTGKTLAVWLGPLLQWLSRSDSEAAPPSVRVLWITPLRALASDTLESLREPLAALAPRWSVETRTGDTSASIRQRQRQRLAPALVTTPESLSLLLSYPEAPQQFRDLDCVIVDEWHELMGTKRGVQTELALAALRQFAPSVRTWGLSATMGNLDQAMETLLGTDRGGEAVLVHGPVRAEAVVETIRPDSTDRFPWAGHLGVVLLPKVLAALEPAASSLIFTNTRSQAEIWFQAIVKARPAWLGEVALHHGSLDRAVRQEVEARLRRGALRAVVCTSSLDLGVDFSPVEQVIQIGSPKGIGRFLQRAGRSGHRPGAVSRIVGVPTNALELIEFAAARDRLAGGQVEPRPPLDRPLDVLVQHVVTRALGGGCEPAHLFDEVRRTVAFRHLSKQEWGWVLDFVTSGGRALTAYPDYARVTVRNGRLLVERPDLARRHRMNVGTITSDSAMQVRFLNGRSLGSIEESFIARLRPGDRFVFAGRVLELVRVRQMTAQVRAAKTGRGPVPRWMGGRSPLSTHLAEAVRQRLHAARERRFEGAEMTLVRPLLQLQAEWSLVPAADQLLIEQTRSRDGHHCFLFLLEGRQAQEGLGALLAHRLTRIGPRSVTFSANDYGLELLCREPLPSDEPSWRSLLSDNALLEDLLAAMNATELARRQFRGIARIAGLVFPGFPGQGKSTRQLQASSDLFFDVFLDFDPTNLLLDQARREVLDRELEVSRLRRALAGLATRRLTIVQTARLTPLAFPIWADRLRAQHVSTERWEDRIRQMVARLEGVAARGSVQREAPTCST